MTDIDFRYAELSAAAIKFIATFLRFEFALKETSFCIEDGDARVNWVKLSNVLGSEFFEMVRHSGNAKELLRQPPKKQVVVHRTLDFKPQSAPKNEQQLFEAVRRVRDNLVHGGKHGHPDADPANQDRNEKLVSEAQWIVVQVLQSDRLIDVRGHFEGRY